MDEKVEEITKYVEKKIEEVLNSYISVEINDDMWEKVTKDTEQFIKNLYEFESVTDGLHETEEGWEGTTMLKTRIRGTSHVIDVKKWKTVLTKDGVFKVYEV